MDESTGNSDSLLVADKATKPTVKQAPTKADGYAEMADNTRKIERNAEELRQNRKEGEALDVPKPPKLELAPEYKNTSPLEAFGSIATAFGLLASTKTRQPLTSGLNAAGDAMRSLKEGNIQDYQLKMQEWKDHTDLALKQFDVENKQFQNIIAKKNLTQAELVGELNAWAAANHNIGAQMQLRQGDAHIALEGARLAESARARTQAHADEVAARNTQLGIHIQEQQLKTAETLVKLGLPADKLGPVLEKINQGVPFGQAIQDSGTQLNPGNKEKTALFEKMLPHIDPKEVAAAGKWFSENVDKSDVEIAAGLAQFKPKGSPTQQAAAEKRQTAIGSAISDLQEIKAIIDEGKAKGETVTGAKGTINRYIGAAGSAIGKDWGGDTAARFQQQVSSVQSRLRDLINVPGSRLGADVRANAHKILSGLSNATTPKEASDAVDAVMKTIIEGNGPPLDAPEGAQLDYFYIDKEHPEKGGSWSWYYVNPETGKAKLLGYR